MEIFMQLDVQRWTTRYLDKAVYNPQIYLNTCRTTWSSTLQTYNDHLLIIDIPHASHSDEEKMAQSFRTPRKKHIPDPPI